MEIEFAVDYDKIVEKLDQVNPLSYGATRNYINGAVTYLSPYISRGVISTKKVLEHLLEKGYKIAEMESFVRELCWRDYFQRVAQEKDLHQDIKQAQTPVFNYEIPTRVLNAATGIAGIDEVIAGLYQSGYMHNHCRMYTAALICNVAKCHWLHPAQWMYYHLLDGDWASNACSWQWVAGANSNKKYFANQENINKYAHTNQINTYLDTTSKMLETMETPAELLETGKFIPGLDLPSASEIQIDNRLPTFVYNYYNLDPLWHIGEPGNRIILLEPGFFARYPVSKKCINFTLALSNNIPGIQLFAGSFELLSAQCKLENIYYKEHPFNTAYQGTREERDWIAKEVTGYYPSFFSYWKMVKKVLYN